MCSWPAKVKVKIAAITRKHPTMINHLYFRFASLLFLLLPLGLSAQDCLPEECLWPGDANRNGVCNNMDYLWIGLATQDVFGGPMRDDATFTWTPQPPPADWDGSFPVSAINYKYADTNGDGWIDGDDYEIFPTLYGQFNEQFSEFLGHEIPGDDLFMNISNPNPVPGETVEVSIHLGSEANPIEAISGLAFTITWDTAIVNEQASFFSDQGGWMGTIGDDFYAVAKLDIPLGIVQPELAFTRLEGTTASGAGEIARMHIVIEDVIVGLDGEPVDSVRLDLGFLRVLGINAFEEDMLITSQPNSLLITATEEAPLSPEQPVEVSVFVAGQKLYIKGTKRLNSLLAYDLTGRIICRRAVGFTELEFPVSDWPAGIYLVQLQSDTQQWIEKVVVF